MGPRATVALILVLCLVLVVVVYITGVEVGAASKLRAHPGYEATRASLVI
jgi:type II secretory pathway component PulK